MINGRMSIVALRYGLDSNLYCKTTASFSIEQPFTTAAPDITPNKLAQSRKMFDEYPSFGNESGCCHHVRATAGTTMSLWAR